MSFENLSYVATERKYAEMAKQDRHFSGRGWECEGVSVTTPAGVMSVVIIVVITEISFASLQRPSYKMAEVPRHETPSSSASYISFYEVSNWTERCETRDGFVSVYACCMSLLS